MHVRIESWAARVYYYYVTPLYDPKGHVVLHDWLVTHVHDRLVWVAP